MDSGQTFRQLGRNLRASLANFIVWLRKTVGEVYARLTHWAGQREGALTFVMGLNGIWRAVVFVLLALIVIYPLGAWWASTIDDDPAFGVAVNALKPTQSLAIANAAALLDREVNDHGWTPNDTFLWPTALLDNMPNYQRGILTALAHFASRLAAASPQDEDLKQAAELLQYPPDVWVWQPSASLWPASSEHKYNKAIESLRLYNVRIGAGGTISDRSPRILASLLTQMATDLGTASARIDEHLDKRAGFFISSSADDLFYNSKGEMYGYYVVLKGAERDFAAVIKQRGASESWRQMMNALHGGVTLRPWFVLNGKPDSQFIPCPLCAEGFYLLRARAQMQEMAERLK